MRIVELDGRLDHQSSDTAEPSEKEGQQRWWIPGSAPSPDDSPYCAPGGSALLGPSIAADRRSRSSRLREAQRARRARDLVHIDDLRSVAPSDVEAVLTAKRAGAKSATDELGELLGPDCTMFLRYRNPRGVIDQLLLCPRGLVAMTSLYLNATVHCDRDDWRADRFNNFEQFIGQFQLTADAGQSPSTQLNEPADLLEEQLYLAGLEIGILRVIFLNHPRSRRGHCRRATVDNLYIGHRRRHLAAEHADTARQGRTRPDHASHSRNPAVPALASSRRTDLVLLP
jgi:hypothetical protein